MASIRLNRYLAQCNLGSRRECDRIIASGVIMVNGEIVREMGTRINPDQDQVEHAGKKVERIHSLQYAAFYKSRGTVVTAHDPQGRETIYDALTRVGFDGDHLKYVGRLDRDSEGLLLLTNDGDCIHGLTHPRFQIKKVYEVKIDKPVAKNDSELMIGEGILSEGQVLRAGRIFDISTRKPDEDFWYEIDLYEGKNRQIRRMFEARGYKILRLKRTQFGPIKLGRQKRGTVRELMDREIKALLNFRYKKINNFSKVPG